MRWAALLGLVWCAGVTAQPVHDTDVDALRGRYDYGQFSEVESAAQVFLDRGGLTPPQLVTVHLYAGLAAFNLRQRELAERHFRALLRVDPDYKLDPFLAPPPALRAFDEVRQAIASELEGIRRQQAKTAQDKEAQRAQIEAQGRQASTRQTQGLARNLWVDFIPFGAGQFQQGRPGAGIAFATSETLLAATSLVTFFLYNGLIQSVTLPVNNQSLGGTGQVEITGIPRDRQRTAEVLKGLNLGSTVALYAVYAGGVVEALVRHRDEERPVVPPPPPPPSVTVGAQGAGVNVVVRF